MANQPKNEKTILGPMSKSFGVGPKIVFPFWASTTASAASTTNFVVLLVLLVAVVQAQNVPVAGFVAASKILTSFAYPVRNNFTIMVKVFYTQTSW